MRNQICHIRGPYTTRIGILNQPEIESRLKKTLVSGNSRVFVKGVSFIQRGRGLTTEKLISTWFRPCPKSIRANLAVRSEHPKCSEPTILNTRTIWNRPLYTLGLIRTARSQQSECLEPSGIHMRPFKPFGMF